MRKWNDAICSKEWNRFKRRGLTAYVNKIYITAFRKLRNRWVYGTEYIYELHIKSNIDFKIYTHLT